MILCTYLSTNSTYLKYNIQQFISYNIDNDVKVCQCMCVNIYESHIPNIHQQFT